MKKIVTILFLSFFVCFVLNAQSKDEKNNNTVLKEKADTEALVLPNTSDRKIDTAKIEVPNIYAWKITPLLGERIFVPRDTSVLNFHRTMITDGKGVAIGYLGNIGSPAISKIFSERPIPSHFVFMDAMRMWRKNPEDVEFLNTKVPYSNIRYQSGGSNETAENRFQAEMSMNFGKKLNFGFDFDYLYARGFYKGLSNKQVSYDFFASYIGDKYKMHAFVANNNYTNIENGGIKDPRYITDAQSDSIRIIEKFNGSSMEIPVWLEQGETWNKLRGRHIYITNRYDLGNDTEKEVIDDTTVVRRKKLNYVPLASVIFTTHYTDQRRRITSKDSYLDSLYQKPYININGDYQSIISKNGEIPLYRYGGYIDDFMSYYSFKNTIALAMNEGFRSWTKFGLTAFMEFDILKYSKPIGGLPIVDDEKSIGLNFIFPGIHERASDNSLVMGGVLSKEKGKYLKYRLLASKDLLHNDFNIEGDLSTTLIFMDKKISAKANAYVKNIRPSYFQNHFASKYWIWDTNFGDTRRMYAGGEITLPKFNFFEAKISGSFENIQNYIYYDYRGLPQQESKHIQLLTLRFDHHLHTGILHWENNAVLQTLRDGGNDVIPVPTLSTYSNLYITSKIAKVLTFQLGVDANFHTKYYAPGYDLLTMQFYNQKQRKIGGFPITTGYLNLHLKNTHFFLMMYNLLQGVGNSDYFSLYQYPVNPRILKFGISWKFNN